MGSELKPVSESWESLTYREDTFLPEYVGEDRKIRLLLM